MSLRYEVDIVINKSIEEVIDLFQNRENDYKWMEGLKVQEVIEGQPNEEGSKTRLEFDLKGKDFKMIETLVKKNLPDEYVTHYEAPNVDNTVISSFTAVSPNQTRYVTDNEFVFSGLMKLMSPLMKGAFKKQSQKYLVNFKTFIENE